MREFSTWFRLDCSYLQAKAEHRSRFATLHSRATDGTISVPSEPIACPFLSFTDSEAALHQKPLAAEDQNRNLTAEEVARQAQ